MIQLLPSERIRFETPATLGFRLADYGLKAPPLALLTVLSVLFGSQGMEASHGKVTLTNFRLVFTSTHALNRLKGELSIILPTISRVDPHNFGMFKWTRIRTANRELFLYGKYMGWWSKGVSNDRLMQEIEDARRSFSSENIAALQSELRNVRDVIVVNKTINAVVTALRAAKYFDVSDPSFGIVTAHNICDWIQGNIDN